MKKSKNQVAVIGMSVWVPGARTLKEYWENILATRQQFRRILDCRLPLRDYQDVTRKNPDSIYGESAAYIEDFDFNWKDFKIPKPTFLVTDPAQWLALEVCFNAFKDAGFSVKLDGRESVGVIIGNSLTGEISRAHKSRLWWPYIRRAALAATEMMKIEGEVRQGFIENFENLFKSTTLETSEDSLPGLLANTIAGRVCNYLDLGGGGYTVDGACASSLLAVAHAANALVNREMDMAIAGGVDISLDISELAGFSKIGALTPDRMTPFDRAAKGFIPGEGAGAVVLKRLEDAERDGNQIYAVINGWGISSDGEGGITAPKSSGQALAIERAYAKAGYSINEVDLFEGHGTGTSVGDRREIEALNSVAGNAPNPQARRAGITTVKSIIGHTKGAAGIASFIKAAIAANRRTLPPTAGCQNPIPAFDGGAKTLYPILEGCKLDRNRKVIVGVSAMGFGGINCHVTLESYGAELAKLSPSNGEERAIYSREGFEVFLFSAQSSEDLKRIIDGAIQEIEFASVAELIDLSAGLSGRVNESDPYKAGVVGCEVKDLSANLKILLNMLASGVSPGKVVFNKEKTCWLSYRTLAPRIGYLFPGQGSQRINSAKFLLHRYGENKELLNLVGADSDFVNALYKNLGLAEGPDKISEWERTLSLTENAQPAICFSSILWFKHLERLGLQPVVTAGHSLGELTAFYAAGAISEIDLINLALLRGQLMKANPESSAGMTSLTCDRATAGKLITGESVVIANFNCPTQTVIAGLLSELTKVETRAQELGIRATRLKVSNAFHSPFMKEASEKFYRGAQFNWVKERSACTVRVGKDGSTFNPESDLKKHLAEQILSPVDFVSLAQQIKKDCDLLIEVGPGNILSNLIADQDDELICLPVDARSDSIDYKVLIAALFTNSCPLNLGCLFEGRIVRTYVPFHKRKFIINPLENPQALVNKQGLGVAAAVDPRITGGGPKVQEKNEVQAIVSQMAIPPRGQPNQGLELRTKTSMEVLIDEIEKLTGYAREAINPELRLLDGLNLDSIKAGELISRVATLLDVSQNIDPTEFANSSLMDIAKAFDLAGAKPLVEKGSGANTEEVVDSEGSSRVVTIRPKADQPASTKAPGSTPTAAQASSAVTLDLIYEEIIAMTGYDRSSLNPELRLLDGLNLDSIKATELIGRTLQKLSLVGEVDPTEFANASIGDIAKALDGKRRDGFSSVVLEEIKTVSSLDVNGSGLSETFSESLGHSDIKMQRVIRNSIKAVGSHTGIDVDSVKYHPVAKVAEIVDRLGQDLGARKRATKQKVRPDLPGGNWVHDFTLTMVPAPLAPDSSSARVSDDPKCSRVVIVCESPDSLGVAAIAQEVIDLGGISKIATYYDFQNGIPAEFRDYSHFVAVFPETMSQVDSEDQVKTCLRRLMSISRPPMAAEFDRRYTSVCYIQFSGGAFGQESSIYSLDQTCTRTFAATLHKERSDLRVRSIDCVMVADLRSWAKAIVKEFYTSSSYEAVGFNGNLERAVPHIVCDRKQKPRKIQVDKNDVILITAGGKGITAECAKSFAKKYQCKIILVGSSVLSGDPSDEVNCTMQGIREAGCECEYYTCDMGRKQAVLNLIETVRMKYGRISGVIHGAGVNRPARIADLKFTTVLSEISPKLFGTFYLSEGLEVEDLKFFFVFNSSTGVIGLEGNAGYAMSNEAVGYYLRILQGRYPKTEFISVAWGAWDEVGMAFRMTGAKKFAGLGTNMMPAREAVDHFMKLFEYKPADLIVPISSRVGDSELEIGPAGFRKVSGRFLEDIQVHMPEIETISRSHLSLEADPHLADHVIDGTVVLPAVFGIEAMLQACAHALGQERLASYLMKDIRFDLPIIVGPKGVTIEVYAQRTRESLAGVPEFRAGILCSSTEFRKQHFSMTVEVRDFEEEQVEFPSLKKPLELDPRKEFYPKLLFHGPRYQKIKAVYELSENEIVYSCQMDTLRASATLSFGENCTHPLIGGDPFFRDAVLQGLQAVQPDAVFVPVSIDEWQVRKGSNGPESFSARAKMSGVVEGVGTSEIVVVDKKGVLVEKIVGFRAKKIRSRSGGPIDLEGHRDLRSVSGTQDTMATEMSRMMSAIPFRVGSGVKKIQGLSQMNKDQRHELETHHAGEVFSQFGGTGFGGVSWDNSGVPHLRVTTGPFTHVSFSHKEDYLVTCLHESPVSCDIERVQTRARAEWALLLGKKRAPAFEQFLQHVGDLNLAGTACWSFFECLAKLGIEKKESFELRYDKSILNVRMNHGGKTVNSFGFLIEIEHESFWVCFAEFISSRHEVMIRPTTEDIKNVLSLIPSRYEKIRLEILCPDHDCIVGLKGEDMDFDLLQSRALTIKSRDGRDWARLEVSGKDAAPRIEPEGQRSEILLGPIVAAGVVDFVEKLAECEIGPQNNISKLYTSIADLRDQTFKSLNAFDFKESGTQHAVLLVEFRLNIEEMQKANIEIQMKIPTVYERGVQAEYLIISRACVVGRVTELILTAQESGHARALTVKERAVLVGTVTDPRLSPVSEHNGKKQAA